MSSFIKPHTFIALRLPSGTHKVLKIIPDTTISLGKYGSFAANAILHKPYYLTFEILEVIKGNDGPPLRVVPASELHADSLTEDPSPSESRDESSAEGHEHAAFDLISENGEYLVRNNRLTIDDASRQTLTFDEIEELKKAETGSGKDIIAKIMQSHSGLKEKTAYSLAKYTLRKTKKFMKRFTVLPLDISMLVSWMVLEKEPSRVMELREETLALMTSWANVRMVDPGVVDSRLDANDSQGRGRWLVIDDTGGLLVAVVAEKLGILHKVVDEEDESNDDSVQVDLEPMIDTENGTTDVLDSTEAVHTPHQSRKSRRHAPDAMSATSNTITLIHTATEPNVSLLSYFGYVPNDSSAPDPSQHPLHTHLKTISWLQVVSPELDSAYHEPEVVPDDILSTWKSGKRGAYFRKRRRWERTKRIADETRAGGFDGLIVTSSMVPESILRHAVPLLAGGAQVVVYSPTVEPLVGLVDSYSTARKTAFISATYEGRTSNDLLSGDDFLVDPRLLLAPSLQTVRAKEWQVLPGRTHPLMTARGGAEGFLFTGTRVLPAAGRVEARGKFSKKRKIEDVTGAATPVINGSGTLESHDSIGDNLDIQ